jgi:hypothetical protein
MARAAEKMHDMRLNHSQLGTIATALVTHAHAREQAEGPNASSPHEYNLAADFFAARGENDKEALWRTQARRAARDYENFVITQVTDPVLRMSKAGYLS